MEKPLKQSLISKRFAPDQTSVMSNGFINFFVFNLKDDGIETGQTKPRQFAFQFGEEIILKGK